MEDNLKDEIDLIEIEEDHRYLENRRPAHFYWKVEDDLNFWGNGKRALTK